MPAASKLSVTRVSCKSIRHCLYFTRGWLLRILILFVFKNVCMCMHMRVCVRQKVKIILETDFSLVSLMKVALVELTAYPVNMAGEWEEGSFPRLKLALYPPSSAPATQTYLLAPWTCWGNIFTAVTCTWLYCASGKDDGFPIPPNIILEYMSHKY